MARGQKSSYLSWIRAARLGCQEPGRFVQASLLLSVAFTSYSSALGKGRLQRRKNSAESKGVSGAVSSHLDSEFNELCNFGQSTHASLASTSSSKK